MADDSLPPGICRQNASCLSWPPDPIEDWVYRQLSPVQITEALRATTDEEVALNTVCDLFLRPPYRAYADNWRDELEEGRSQVHRQSLTCYFGAMRHRLSSSRRS